MPTTLWHINGQGFHFGRHGLGQEESFETLPSDTLFAALLNCLAELQGTDSMKRWVQAFQGTDPPFTFTSAFPRAGEVHFYPLPLQQPKASANYERHEATIKEIQFVSEGVFRKLIDGISVEDLLPDEEKIKDFLLQGKEILLLPEERERLPKTVKEDGFLWEVKPRSRAMIGRIHPSAGIFQTGRISYAKECGLWFGCRLDDPQNEHYQQLPDIFHALGDAGLGGIRSAGFGLAKFQNMGSIDLPGMNGKPWVTLSRYLPKVGEISALTHPQAAYSLINVEGWVQSAGKKSERRRALNMVCEGSVLGPVADSHPGEMVDIQPDYDGQRPLKHEVWRNGRAFAVGISTSEGKGG